MDWKDLEEEFKALTDNRMNRIDYQWGNILNYRLLVSGVEDVQKFELLAEKAGKLVKEKIPHQKYKNLISACSELSNSFIRNILCDINLLSFFLKY